MILKFKLIIAVLFLLCIFSSGFAQGNWELILPPYPSSNHLVSLYFIDEYTGWVVGENGTILKTTDSGENWKLIEIQWLSDLLDVYFPTKDVGYAVGKDGQIVKSIDGGMTWSKLEVRYTNNLNRVMFRDEEHGWIIGEKGLILYTDDGGLSWHQQVSNSPGDLKGIALIDISSLCIVGTDSTVLISNDNGKNWKPAEVTSNDWSEYNNLNDVFFLNDTLGWIGGIKTPEGRGIILKTTDRGQSWIEELKFVEARDYEYCGEGKYFTSTGVFPYGIQQVYFKDLQHGLYLTDNNSRNDKNIPYYTSSEGKYWIHIMNGCEEYSNKTGRFYFLTEDTVINTCYGGEFRFSYDRGLTWDYPNDSKRVLRKMIVGNQGKLLASTKISYDSSSYVFSNDFGKSWHDFYPQVFDSAGNPIDFKINPTSGSFIDDGETLWNIKWGQIFESKDFGQTWHCIRSGLNVNPSVSKFLATDTLVHYELDCVEDTPGNYKSELLFNVSFDGGRTVISKRFEGLWNDITPPRSFNDKNIYGSHFFNGHTGFLVGSEGNIIKTADTGQHWKSIYSGVVDDLMDIEFIDRFVGFVVGEFGRILKTEDGGETWRKTNSGTQEDIYAVAFKNANEGWVGTENGLRYTKDGGENWEGIPLRYYRGLVRYIKFDKQGNCYAYTPCPSRSWEEMGIDNIMPNGYTYLLCWRSDESLVESSQDDEIFPETLTLYPNYPNPFNAGTGIVYYLPETGSVNLKIYNIKGQLIRTLVDEYQGSGEHTVLWDGLSDYSQEVTSGVYVYRLGDGNEVRTRKMMLLR